MQENNTYNITAYNLFDFLLEVQKAVQQGFVLSEDNKNFPQAYISLYTCTLVKEDKPEDETIAKVETIVAEKKTEVVTAEVKKTAGRPPKGSK